MKKTDANAKPLIVADKISKRFGSLQVLKEVSLEIFKGEVIVIVGPSGSGKSTFIRTLNGLEKIESGHISFDGHELKSLSSFQHWRKEMGMVFQSFNLFPHLSVL